MCYTYLYILHILHIEYEQIYNKLLEINDNTEKRLDILTNWFWLPGVEIRKKICCDNFVILCVLELLKIHIFIVEGLCISPKTNMLERNGTHNGGNQGEL